MDTRHSLDTGSLKATSELTERRIDDSPSLSGIIVLWTSWNGHVQLFFCYYFGHYCSSEGKVMHSSICLFNLLQLIVWVICLVLWKQSHNIMILHANDPLAVKLNLRITENSWPYFKNTGVSVFKPFCLLASNLQRRFSSTKFKDKEINFHTTKQQRPEPPKSKQRKTRLTIIAWKSGKHNRMQKRRKRLNNNDETVSKQDKVNT